MLLLIPLVYTEQLGGGWIQSSVLRTPGTPPTPPIRQASPHTRSASSIHRLFNPLDTPLSIPRTIPANFGDDQPAPPPCAGCVEGSIGTGVEGSIGFGTPDRLPPPPAKPKPAAAKKAVDPPPAAPVNVSQGTQEAKIIRRVIPTYPHLPSRPAYKAW